MGDWELPAGWEWVQIQEIGTFRGGGTPSKSKSEYWNGTIPWVSPKDMKSLEIQDTQDQISSTGLANSSAKLIPSGAVLIVFRSGILAHSLPVAIAKRELTVNQDLKTIVLRDHFDPYFILFALLAKSDMILSRCTKKGATVHSLEYKRFLLEKLPIPYPDDLVHSLDEQRRIVARIKELFDRIEEARRLRVTAAQDARELMLASLMTALKETETRYPGELRLDELTEITSGGTPSRSRPEYYTGDTLWVKTSELQDGLIYDTEEHITEEAIENSSAKLFPPGTLLIAMYGQGKTRGRTGVLAIPATTNQACCAILPAEDRFTPVFLQYWFMSMYGELRHQSEMRGGNQPNLNAGIIKSLKPPLPPLPEQRRIVEYLDGVQAQVAELKRIQAESAAELERLEGAILAQAFRGEL